MIRKPNLLIVGAAKSGTTSLHSYLNEHPEIFMSTKNKRGENCKEPQFLVANKVKNRLHFGVWTFEEYLDLFSDANDSKIIGESSVFYLYYYKEAIENIKSRLGNDVKIIIILRNPVDRAFSAFLHVSKGMKESLSFEDALAQEEGRLGRDLTLTPMVMYKDMGMYYSMVKAYKKEFKNVHVVIYEDFRDKTNITLDGVFKFLDVIPTGKVDFSVRHNVGGEEWKSVNIKNLFQKDNLLKSIYFKLFPLTVKNKIKEKLLYFSTNKARAMNNKTKVNLKSFFKEDVNRLSNLVQRDLTHWTK